MKVKNKGRIKIQKERCKGCGYCIEVCPNKCIEFDKMLNSKGYLPACFSKENKCLGCSSCAIICPDIAITVWRD